MEITSRDAVAVVFGLSLGALVCLATLGVLGLRPGAVGITGQTTGEFTYASRPLVMFTGQLLIDHAQSYLVQSSEATGTVQTLLIRTYGNPGPATPSQCIASATGFLRDIKHIETGTRVTILGSVATLNSIPMIDITDTISGASSH
jgi:hypothetical protein